MKHDHFTDERIDDIRSGRSPLTAEERAFLIEDTPRLEECTYTEEELTSMSDADLMSAAYSAWADYARSMF
jgi:hypothetical protein